MKGLIVILNSILCSIFIMIVVILCSIFSIFAVIINPGGDLSFKIMKISANLMLWFCRVKVFVEGLENIDKDNVYIFASNHSSHSDILVITSILPVKTGWVAKKELFSIPFLGWLMRANGHISVDRESGRKALKSMKEAAEKVRNGNNIAIFPEGTRSRDGELQPFKKGVFHLCIRTSVPVIPVYITGTNHVLKPDTLSFRPGKVYVKIGEGVSTADYPKNKTRDLMDDVRERFLELQEDVVQSVSR